MPKELKFIILFLFVLPIIAFSFVVFKTQSSPVLAEIKGLESPVVSYELGEVPRLGGVVTKEYTFNNTTDKTMKLYKITTSCMCTKAKVVVGDKETNFYGLEHTGDKNAPVFFDIKPGQTAKVVVVFDPNAHGPKGVGAFDRTVQLVFSDPQGVKEFKFSGNVIEK
jgi:hypothetical protein